MKIATFLLALLALTFSMLSCSPSSATEQRKSDGPLGDYQYTGYDKSGVKIVQGRLSITSVEADKLEGEWQFEKIGNPERIGPQVGKGTLEGSIIKGEIFINLNPNTVDNNVDLRGQLEGKRFHGTWSYDGFAAGINKGTFEALRK